MIRQFTREKNLDEALDAASHHMSRWSAIHVGKETDGVPRVNLGNLPC
jgi:hypothetical protein